MKRALLIKNREYNGICIDFVLAKLMGNRHFIENHRQSGKEIAKSKLLRDFCAIFFQYFYVLVQSRIKRGENLVLDGHV